MLQDIMTNTQAYDFLLALGAIFAGLTAIIAAMVALRVHTREKLIDHRELARERANTMYDEATREIGGLGQQAYYKRVWGKTKWVATAVMHNVRTGMLDVSVFFTKSRKVENALKEISMGMLDGEELKEDELNENKNQFKIVYSRPNGLVLYLYLSKRTSWLSRARKSIVKQIRRKEK